MSNILPQENSDSLIEKNFKRNVFAIVLFDFVWGMGMPFASFLTMAPGYLTEMGASKTVIGIVQILWTIATPLQIVSAYAFSGAHRRRNSCLLFMLGVSIWLFYIVIILIFGPGLSNGFLICGFVIAAAGFMAGISMGSPLYTSVVTDNIPMRKRGRIFGLRTLGLGIAGILMGFIASRLLNSLPSPRNFEISFFIGTSLFLLSCLSLVILKDENIRTPGRPKRKLHIHVKKILFHVWRNPNYRIFLFFHLLIVCAIAISGFFIPFARDVFKIPASRVSLLTVIYLGCSAAAGLGLGRLADKFGYKIVCILQAVSLICAFCLVIAAKSFLWICFAYVFYTIPIITQFMTLTNMSVELSPHVDPGDLSALGSIIILPVVAFISPLCGAIIDITGLYLPVFLIGITLSLTALIGIIVLVREPRTGRLYVIKRLPMR